MASSETRNQIVGRVQVLVGRVALTVNVVTTYTEYLEDLPKGKLIQT